MPNEPDQPHIPNAWLICTEGPIGHTIHLDASTSYHGVRDGDYAVVVASADKLVRQFARIHRIRTDLKSVTLYFDAAEVSSSPAGPASLGLPIPTTAVERLEWDPFVQALHQLRISAISAAFFSLQ